MSTPGRTSRRTADRKPTRDNHPGHNEKGETMSKNTNNTNTSSKANVEAQATDTSKGGKGGKVAPVVNATAEAKSKARAGKLDYIAALIHAAADTDTEGKEAPLSELRTIAEKLAHRLTGARAKSPTGKNPETIPGQRLALIRVCIEGSSASDRATAKKLATALLPTLATPANVEVYDSQERNDLVYKSLGYEVAE